MNGRRTATGIVAGAGAVGSFFTFDFFFVPPLHSFEIARGEDAVAIGVSLLAASLVGELSRRAREGAAEARVRAREAALRRVATLVARDARPEDGFAAVAEEVGRLLVADGAAIARPAGRRRRRGAPPDGS
jgi:two-component system, OmpR family, sensor histidine kinase KdpD